MSDADLNKAAKVRAPHDLGQTANDFGVMNFTAPTTHAAHVLPNTWQGQWAELHVVGGTAGTDYVDYAFSLASNAEVDTSVAATAAGISAKVGGRIPTGEKVMVLIPKYKTPGQGPVSEGDIYFVREGSAADMSVRLRLASGG